MAKELDHQKLFEVINAARNKRRVAGEVMSWHKLALRAGLSPSTVMNWANHQDNPKRFPKFVGLACDSLISLLDWAGEYDLSKVLKDVE